MMLRLFKQYYPIRNAIFVLGEGLIIFSSVIVACVLVIGEKNLSIEYVTIFKALLITVLCQACLYYNDLYNFKTTGSFSELGIRLFQSLGVAAILLSCVYFIFPDVIIKEGIFIISILLVIGFIISWRVMYAQIINHGLFDQKIIIIGSGHTAKEIAKEILEKKDSGYKIAAAISREPMKELPCNEGIGLICQNHYENICEIALQWKVRKIVVALAEKRGSFPTKELLKCRVNGIEVLDGNSFYEMLTGKLIVEHTNPGWFIFSEGFQKSLIQKILKRIIDMLFSILLLILTTPLILVTALLIKIDSKGPVIFSQERVGEQYKKYKIYKFRSMLTDAEKTTGPVWAKDKDDRITRIGHFIRKWRIDEIPQLWNVLKGEMSFVGPRPERDHFIKQLTDVVPYYGERLTVKPGLTGWAQVSYGYGSSVRDSIEKLNYDLFYIKNMSILMDVMIIARTVRTVIFGHGR